MDSLRSACKLVQENQFNEPTYIFHRAVLTRKVEVFKNLQCKILYAVKTNPEEIVIKHLINQGVHSFDVASIGEIELITRLSKELNIDCKMYFMHPVKPRYAIREAYFNYGIRNFSLDSQHELEKILEETNHAKDLCLHLRIAVKGNYAKFKLSEKFGIEIENAPSLLRRIKQVAFKTGVSFHVGSQCENANAFKNAIEGVAKIVNEIPVDTFNIGGGFPSIYPSSNPTHTLEEFFEIIHKSFEKLENKDKIEFLAEVGRGLVAECMSLIVRVDLRKGEYLYINDGTYGGLFDAGQSVNFIFPMKLLRESNAPMQAFKLYGPTCDSLDYMEGSFELPSDIKEGDYIEIMQMGAYSKAIATSFNGFKPNNEIFEFA